MAKKILIMGLPGSGKTALARALKTFLEENSTLQHLPVEALFRNEIPPGSDWHATVDWFNADDVRKKFNDWDFSKEGRIRQSLRMADFALNCTGEYVICDFVAPLVEMRNNFKADWTIWMDTIESGRFEDTNKAFVPPSVYDFRVTELDANKWAEFIGLHILEQRRRPKFDWQKETVQLLGRWQPWSAKHKALFERAIAKTGQVVIQIRDCQGWNDSNPFALEQVRHTIKRDLDPLYQGQYEIQVVPNIVHITYGKNVGYTIAQETFTDSNATPVRHRKTPSVK